METEALHADRGGVGVDDRRRADLLRSVTTETRASLHRRRRSSEEASLERFGVPIIHLLLVNGVLAKP